MSTPVHDSWSSARLGSALLVAAAWGLAVGAVDTAWFTLADTVYPTGPGHVALALVLAVPHALIAAGAVLAVTVLTSVLPGARGGLGAAMRLWAGPWALALLLATSIYRDHMLMVRFPGTIADKAITLGILAVAIAAWLGTSAAAARRSLGVSRGLLLGTAAVVAFGCLVRVATSSPPTWELPADAVAAADAGPVDDTGLRILVIGVDGGTWKTLDPLREAGRMPNLQALCRRGVTARLHTDLPTYSPNLWTSIATGKTLEKHGIPTHVYSTLPLGLPDVAQRPEGIAYLTKVMKYAIRLADRAGMFSIGVYGAEKLRARRYWDIAGEFGLPSVTLEWYVTHPAEAVLGVEVSDRFHLLEGEALKRAVFPDELAPGLESDIVRQPDLMDDVLRFADTDGMTPEDVDRLASGHSEIFETLAHEMARDLTTRNLVGSVFPRIPDWRVGSVYFRAMDGSHHTAWQYREAGASGPEEPANDPLAPVVDRYTVFCDELIAAPLALADSSTVVIMLSDHGWDNAKLAHARKPDGFFIMAGGPVRASGERADATVYDVAPTILALLGIPVPEDMDGRVLAELLDPAFLESHPVRHVPSYEHEGRRHSGSDAAADEQFLEQLRALGYVGQ